MRLCQCPHLECSFQPIPDQSYTSETTQEHIHGSLLLRHLDGAYVGNVNCYMFGRRNTADLTELIDNMCVSKSPPCCPACGNVAGSKDGRVNLTDNTESIDYVYITKAETAAYE